MKRVNDGSGRGGHGRGGHGERDHSENRGSGGSGRRGDFDRRGGGRSRGDLFGGRGGGGGRGALRDAAIGRYEDLFEGMHPRFNPHFRRAHSGDSGYNRHRDRCFPEIKLARPVPRTPDGGDQHRLKRRYSFDSMYAVTTTEYTVDGDQPPHLNMYEVLDLSPSAPSLHPGQSESLRRNRFSRSNQEYPLAQPADSRVDALEKAILTKGDTHSPSISAMGPLKVLPTSEAEEIKCESVKIE
uniref:Uncharacterized protein n=1 Tax=Globisporangium ultimum (strain ATCC 200006 / CBS 805.95 / DAOM BR144) TaxID=431595 RepID=K3WHN3_GLOUD